jgi:hypothetical protein
MRWSGCWLGLQGEAELASAWQQNLQRDWSLRCSGLIVANGRSVRLPLSSQAEFDLLRIPLWRKDTSPDTTSANYNDSATTHLNPETSPFRIPNNIRPVRCSEAHTIDSPERNTTKSNDMSLYT